MRKLLLTALLVTGCGTSDGGPTILDDYASEDVAVDAADGTVLSGTLHMKNSAAPVVVLFHQLASNRNEWQELRLALQTETEATTLAMDLRGHGQSTQRGTETLDWQDFDNADWADLPGDVASVLAHVRTRGDLQPAAIGLAGSSIGSSAVLLHAATDTGVDTVVLLSPGLDYRGLSTAQPMIDYGARPSLLVATDGDARSADAANTLAASNPDAVATVYTGSSEHGTSMTTDFPELVDAFATWFSDSL